MRRKRLIVAAAAALLAAAIAGGVAYATIPGSGNIYTACMLKGIGTIRLIDKSLPATSLLSHCNSGLEIEVTWNQAGQQGPPGPQGAKGEPGAAGKDGAPGKDGVSVTTAAEAAGPNCAAGGVRLASVTGIAYICHGKDGRDGTNGTDGEDGVSVTSAAEPAGANCASGGAKFTATNGVTYACNGAPGTGGAGWSLGGNAGTNPTTDWLGTSDSQPLDLRVNGARVLHLESGVSSPNLIGGSSANSVSPGVSGATIGGGGFSGLENRASASLGTVAGGADNTAGAFLAVVSGGLSNTASGNYAGVTSGSGNTASGTAAFVAGGAANAAGGDFSFAAGSLARASHDGSFVWSDSSGAAFGSTAANEFSARATGGVRFVSAVNGSGNPTAGVSLAPGSGSWSSLSDRALKRNFAPVDGDSVLARIAGLPISTWGYKAQKPSIRHLGPTAQDFARAFGLGEDQRHIDTIDSEGVSLAGIKALYSLVQVQQRQLAEQRRDLSVLKHEVARLQRSAHS